MGSFQRKQFGRMLTTITIFIISNPLVRNNTIRNSDSLPKYDLPVRFSSLIQGFWLVSVGSHKKHHFISAFKQNKFQNFYFDVS